MPILIREATTADAGTISLLSEQLGYNCSSEHTMHYLTALTDKDDAKVYVAISNGNIVGWIQVICALRLESGHFCEITGLVVDEQHRGLGIGAMLVDKAKEWANNMHCNSLRVRSNIIRQEAHRFYKNAGFRETKQQSVFVIDL